MRKIMDYQNLLLGSQDYINSLDSGYINTYGTTVLVFKLDKEGTILNPIYNEEIDGRKYMRPFEMKCLYKSNPFDFVIKDGLPSETDGKLLFTFNFTSMVQTINSLKNQACMVTIMPPDESGKWSVRKCDGKITFFKAGTDIEIDIDVSKYDTLSLMKEGLERLGFYLEYDDDDYTACIPDFDETKISGSILLKTFNDEFKNVSNVVDQGDLIFIPSIMALYEVNAAFPVNNTMYKYMNWRAEGSRTFAYVNYDQLKKYRYGLNTNNQSSAQVTNTPNCKSEDEFFGDLNKWLDKINGEVV